MKKLLLVFGFRLKCLGGSCRTEHCVKVSNFYREIDFFPFKELKTL